MVFKFMLFLSGVILAVPILIFITLAATLPVTISGGGYLLASSLLIIGLLLAPWIPKSYWVSLMGLLSLVLIAVLRIVSGELNSTSSMSMVTLPQGKEARWVSYIIDEQDSLIFGETLFHFFGGDSNREHDGLVSAFQGAYSEMRPQGMFPSPIVDTYLYLQQPNAFDAVIISPKVGPSFGVIFLHGFMGNVTAQCWEIAQPVTELGGVTVCPSTGWRGEWWQPQGESILQNTFDYLREQGIEKIYLGGFSNGGFGIGRLASQVGIQKGLSGLFFIDGFANSMSIREIGLPVLILQGTLDERVSPSNARQFANEIGDLGTYVEINSDHFLIMKQPDQVQDALAEWLVERTR